MFFQISSLIYLSAVYLKEKQFYINYFCNDFYTEIGKVLDKKKTQRFRFRIYLYKSHRVNYFLNGVHGSARRNSFIYLANTVREQFSVLSLYNRFDWRS